jgi:hypothetical protein
LLDVGPGAQRLHHGKHVGFNAIGHEAECAAAAGSATVAATFTAASEGRDRSLRLSESLQPCHLPATANGS